MKSSWLLQHLFEITFEEKTLKTEFRRRAGKYLRLKISEEEIPLEMLAKYCARFLKSGFEFPQDVKGVLSKKFEEEPDAQVCASALTILKESQVFGIEDYRGWYYKVGSRFEPEGIEEALKTPHISPEKLEQQAQAKILDKKRMIEIVLSAKRGDENGRSKADEWVLEARERYKGTFESLEKEWIEWRQLRLRKTPRQSGTIDVLCNNSTPGKWRILGFKCSEPYRPEILWTEIQSWLKEYGEETEDLLDYSIWDESGRVDPLIQKDPVDGERFAFLLKWKQATEDVEHTVSPGKEDSAVQRFIKRTGWRRKKLIYDTQIWEDEIISPDGPPRAEGTSTPDEPRVRKDLRPSAPSLVGADSRDTRRSSSNIESPERERSGEQTTEDDQLFARQSETGIRTSDIRHVLAQGTPDIPERSWASTHEDRGNLGPRDGRELDSDSRRPFGAVKSITSLNVENIEGETSGGMEGDNPGNLCRDPTRPRTESVGGISDKKYSQGETGRTQFDDQDEATQRVLGNNIPGVIDSSQGFTGHRNVMGHLVDRNPENVRSGSQKADGWVIQKPTRLPELEIQLKTSGKFRTVGERIRIRHQEAKLRFKKKWRCFRNQERVSPLIPAHDSMLPSKTWSPQQWQHNLMLAQRTAHVTIDEIKEKVREYLKTEYCHWKEAYQCLTMLYQLEESVLTADLFRGWKTDPRLLIPALVDQILNLQGPTLEPYPLHLKLLSNDLERLIAYSLP
jgi:hypothetical protein